MRKLAALLASLGLVLLPTPIYAAEVVVASTVAGITVTSTTSISTGVGTSATIKLPDSYTPTTFANGTGARQVTVKWADTRTYSATPTTLDLSSLAAASTNTGAAAFTSVKAIKITNNATAAGFDLIVGAAASNAFTGFLGGTTPTVTIQPGCSFLIDSSTAAGWAVSGAGARNLKLDPGANAVGATIVLIGN